MSMTKDDLQAIEALLQPIISDVQSMKSDMQSIKTDMQSMKSDMKNMDERLARVENKLTDTRLHLENCTDRNIKLLAENFIELTNKLNQAIPAADKNLAYEVKVNYLLDEMDKVKKDVAELKSKVAESA